MAAAGDNTRTWSRHTDVAHLPAWAIVAALVLPSLVAGCASDQVEPAPRTDYQRCMENADWTGEYTSDGQLVLDDAHCRAEAEADPNPDSQRCLDNADWTGEYTSDGQPVLDDAHCR